MVPKHFHVKDPQIDTPLAHLAGDPLELIQVTLGVPAPDPTLGTTALDDLPWISALLPLKLQTLTPPPPQTSRAV